MSYKSVEELLEKIASNTEDSTACMYEIKNIMCMNDIRTRVQTMLVSLVETDNIDTEVAHIIAIKIQGDAHEAILYFIDHLKNKGKYSESKIMQSVVSSLMYMKRTVNRWV